MKKLLILAAIFASAQMAHAQTEKENQTLGVNLQFSHSTSKGVSINPYDNAVTNIDQKYTQFAVGPNYSFFVADKLDLGASLLYTNTNNVNGEGYYPYQQKDHSYGGTIYMRKYFMYQNKVGIRTGPYLGYNHSYLKSTNSPVNAINDRTQKTNSYGGGVNLELLFYPVKQLGVSLMLANVNYNHYKSDSGNQGKTDGDSVNASFINNGLGLSVFYVFGK